MKTIDLPNVPEALAGLLEEARREDVLVRLNDGSEFVLSAVDDFDVEVARTRANAKLMELLDARGRQTQLVPLDEVKRRFGVHDG
jgi:hypothetical protein